MATCQPFSCTRRRRPDMLQASEISEAELNNQEKASTKRHYNALKMQSWLC